MKNKISIYLNMLIICLSICVISIGVYSLTSANLTISGSLGYVYHEKSITATMQNYSTTAGGVLQSTATNLTISEPTYNSTYGSNMITITLPNDIYFKGIGWDAPHIEILVTVKNTEDTDKAVTLLFDDMEGLGYTRKVIESAETTPANIKTNHSSAIILSKGEQTTFRLTLKQSIKKTNLSIAQTDFNIQLSVANYNKNSLPTASTGTTTIDDITYTINDDQTGWSATSHSVSGDVTISPLVKGLPVNTINGLQMGNSGYTLTIPNSVTDIEACLSRGPTSPFNYSVAGSIINLCSLAFASGNTTRAKLVGNCIFNVEVMGNNSFWRMDFEEIELQSDVLTRIERNTLYNISSLKTIILPKNLTEIESSGISVLVDLESIFFTGTIPPTIIGSSLAYHCSSLTAIYVPADAISEYQTALEDLIDDTSIIQAIP